MKQGSSMIYRARSGRGREGTGGNWRGKYLTGEERSDIDRYIIPCIPMHTCIMDEIYTYIYA